MRFDVALSAAGTRALQLALSKLDVIADSPDLRKAREAVERRFGSGMAGSIPDDRLERVIAKLRKGGRDPLARSDRYVLAHAIARPSTQLGGRALLSEAALCAAPLGTWERDAKAGRLRGSHWRGLFHSFLQAEPGEGTERLRRLLKDSWPGLQRQGRYQMPWMQAIGRHEGLLGSRPCEPYIAELLRGERDLLEDLRESVSVPPASWFWTEMTEALLRSIAKSPEREFKSRIPVCLKLAAELPGSPDSILAATLNRYAQCEARPPHQELLRFALDVWKSPQLSRNVLWAQASSQARQMVCGWLALEDLEDFYRLCQGTGEVDERRLKYWLRFKEQIVFSQIVLGSELLYSRDLDIRRFRERKQGRLAQLTSGQGANNAIVMQIGDWIFVEFSQVGNACYPYRVDRTPFDIGESQYGLRELKDPEAVRVSGADRLLHMNRWESDAFDPFLRRCGIYPDDYSTRSVSGRSAVSPVRTASSTGAAPAARPAVQQEPQVAVPAPLSAELVREISAAGGAIVDNRWNGGVLWVLGSGFSNKTVKALHALGFKAKSGKGLWL